MKKTIKNGFIILVLLLIICPLIVINRIQHSKTYNSEKKLFNQHKNDFIIINNDILENYDVASEESVDIISLVSEALEITGYYKDEEIRMDSALQEALNSIKECFGGYDFSFIRVTRERISYAGDGYRMYVYSRTGENPEYYYYKGDGVRFDVYRFDDNWFLLTADMR